MKPLYMYLEKKVLNNTPFAIIKKKVLSGYNNETILIYFSKSRIFSTNTNRAKCMSTEKCRNNVKAIILSF